MKKQPLPACGQGLFFLASKIKAKKHPAAQSPYRQIKFHFSHIILICNQDDLNVYHYKPFGNAFLICGDLRNQRPRFFAFDVISCMKKKDVSR
ncbi:hypothetical protein [Desulfonatronospira thiodismutans]|uniref:hypothetical protein n=1 Tax=Desulfonatronospira thiodismutans TaxID=488939 RepID=UPI00058E6B7E|nr:hypothetical protein [Desulfonatronospira thiodismutans]RQD74383.1 MAG: hypothetical protein D5S03_10450 [Desulfonatronospira sp. MSAO_Bac3]